MTEMDDFNKNLDEFQKIKPDPSNKDGYYSQSKTCPNCGYCPCCGRPRGNFNYPAQPYWGWPYPMTGPTCGTAV